MRFLTLLMAVICVGTLGQCVSAQEVSPPCPLKKLFKVGPYYAFSTIICKKNAADECSTQSSTVVYFYTTDEIDLGCGSGDDCGKCAEQEEVPAGAAGDGDDLEIEEYDLAEGVVVYDGTTLSAAPFIIQIDGKFYVAYSVTFPLSGTISATYNLAIKVNSIDTGGGAMPMPTPGEMIGTSTLSPEGSSTVYQIISN